MRGALLCLLLAACPPAGGARRVPLPPGPAGLEIVVEADGATVTVRRDVELAAGRSELRFPDLPAPSSAAVVVHVSGEPEVVSSLVSGEGAVLAIAAIAPAPGRRRLEISYATAAITWRAATALTFDGEHPDAPATLERRAVVDSRGPALRGARVVLVGEPAPGPVVLRGAVDLPAAGQLVVDLAPPLPIAAFFGNFLEVANPQEGGTGPFLSGDDWDRTAVCVTSLVVGDVAVSGLVEIRRRDAAGMTLLGEGELVDGRLSVPLGDGAAVATRHMIKLRVDHDRREMVETVAIDVRGGAGAPILVADSVYRARTWEIVESNLPQRRGGPGFVHFSVPPLRPEHPTIIYTVRYRW